MISEQEGLIWGAQTPIDVILNSQLHIYYATLAATNSEILLETFFILSAPNRVSLFRVIFPLAEV